MKGTYYKPPIDFKALIEKRDLIKQQIEKEDGEKERAKEEKRKKK